MLYIKRMNKQSVPGHLFDIINIALLFLFTIVCIYPFWYIIIYSLSDPSLALKSLYLLPNGINFKAYQMIFMQGEIGDAFLVSVLRTVIGTILCVVFTSFFAYLTIQKELPARKFIYRFVIFTMYFSPGLIPWFITMRTYGLQNNFLLYILPGTINAFYLVLVRTYMQSLPESLEESAKLDGAGFLKIFTYIIMPLSKPIIATITIYCSVSLWNMWLDNYFLVTDTNLQTLQMVLYNYLNSTRNVAGTSSVNQDIIANISPESVKMASTVITVFPIMLIYPFLQRYFLKGIMIGAIKG